MPIIVDKIDYTQLLYHGHSSTGDVVVYIYQCSGMLFVGDNKYTSRVICRCHIPCRPILNFCFCVVSDVTVSSHLTAWLVV